MNRILPLLLFLSIPFSLFSQVKFSVKGTLADRDDHKGLPYVTVSLTDTATGVANSNSFTTGNGNFNFDNISPGIYFVYAAPVGYLPVKSNIIVVATNEIATDTLYADKASKDLKGVTITAVKPLLEVETDKLIYNVENDATLNGLMALDALRKLPFVTVDAEENIQIKGSANFKVLLNGKSTSIVAKNPSEALKSFPANLIKKIEIITEPSAKYDAEGTAGIINIITKKKVAGVNGNTYFNLNSMGMNNGGGSLNIKRGKFGLSSYFGGRTFRYINQTTTDFLRQTTTPGRQSTLIQHTKSNSKGNSYWGNFEMAYDFDTLHTLSVYLSPYGGNYSSQLVQNSSIADSTGRVRETFDATISNKSKNPSVDYGLDFIKIFKDNPEHEISFSVVRDISEDSSSYTSVQEYTLIPDRDINNNNRSTNIEHTFELDYTKAFKNKTSLETGSKMILRHLVSDYRMLERSNFMEPYTENPFNTNVLQYDQNVGSLYSVYIFNVKKYKVKLGTRVEKTWINARFNMGALPFKSDYINVIPTAAISTKIKKAHTLRLNYSKRIQRPWMFYLNPYVNNQNPRNISYGNPNLLPEKTHSVSLSWNYFYKQNSLDLSLSNTFIDDVITSFTTVENGGISYTTYYNFAKSNSIGINLNFSGSLFEKLQLWAGVTSSYVTITHKTDASRNRSGFNTRGHGNFTWNFKYGWSSTLGGWAWQGAPTLQTVRPLNYNYYVSFRKSVLKKKLNLGLVANNFLQKTQSLKTVSRDPAFYQESISNNLYFRYFSVSFSYNFGKLKESVSKKKGVKNDDTKAE